jgi:hypothetical protein
MSKLTRERLPLDPEAIDLTPDSTGVGNLVSMYVYYLDIQNTKMSISSTQHIRGYWRTSHKRAKRIKKLRECLKNHCQHVVRHGT